MRILIAEDNPLMRRYLKNLVSDMSAVVFECGDGRRAVSLYRELKPDVVLMDVCMPEMDGLEALRAIISEYPRALVLIVTEHDESVYRMEAERCGAAAYFLKDRLQEVRDYLQERREL
jgi:DNA-binding NarL/FixJ family response regulator